MPACMSGADAVDARPEPRQRWEPALELGSALGVARRCFWLLAGDGS